MNGKLIVLDGLDGSGKSTQFELLQENLRKNGKTVLNSSSRWLSVSRRATANGKI